MHTSRQSAKEIYCVWSAYLSGTYFPNIGGSDFKLTLIFNGVTLCIFHFSFESDLQD